MHVSLLGHSGQYQQGSILKVLTFFSTFHHLFGSMRDVIPENFSSIGFTNQILWLFKDLHNFRKFETFEFH